MKFAAKDQRYLAERARLSAKYGPRELWSVLDHWQLYVGMANLGRSLAIADLVRETLSVPGHVAEFGAWRGANTLFLAKLLHLFDPHGQKLVHCFDSFEGLTEFHDKDQDVSGQQGRYQGSVEELTDMLDLYELGDSVVIHKGVIEQTLPALVEGHPEVSFSLVYCDTDLYQSTQVILDHVHPRLCRGGLLVFDEWNTSTFPGEGIAVNEFLGEHGKHYRSRAVQGARQPTLVLEKLSD